MLKSMRLLWIFLQCTDFFCSKCILYPISYTSKHPTNYMLVLHLCIFRTWFFVSFSSTVHITCVFLEHDFISVFLQHIEKKSLFKALQKSFEVLFCLQFTAEGSSFWTWNQKFRFTLFLQLNKWVNFGGK